MKKTIVLLITFMVVLTCFSSCKRTGVIKGGVLATDFKGNGVAAVVTKEDGGIIRDDAGNVIVLATDKNGNTYKEKGEYVTQAVAVEHAIIFDKHVEMPDFAMDIPNGWSDEKSYDMLNISKDGADTMITIMTDRNAKLTDISKNHATMVDMAATGNAVHTTQTVAGQEAIVTYVYSTLSGSGIFIGYIDFMYQGAVFTVQVSDTKDISSSWNDIVKIVDTIDFVH